MRHGAVAAHASWGCSSTCIMQQHMCHGGSSSRKGSISTCSMGQQQQWHMRHIIAHGCNNPPHTSHITHQCPSQPAHNHPCCHHSQRVPPFSPPSHTHCPSPPPHLPQPENAASAPPHPHPHPLPLTHCPSPPLRLPQPASAAAALPGGPAGGPQPRLPFGGGGAPARRGEGEG